MPGMIAESMKSRKEATFPKKTVFLRFLNLKNPNGGECFLPILFVRTQKYRKLEKKLVTLQGGGVQLKPRTPSNFLRRFSEPNLRRVEHFCNKQGLR